METRQHVIDDEHLRLLSIAHYIVAALHFGFSSIFLLHAFMAGAAVFDPTLLPGSGQGAAAPPEAFMKVMFVMVCAFIVIGWTFSALTFHAGRCIARRRRRVFVLVMACLQLPLMPLGTILGACTLVVMVRPGVKAEFADHEIAVLPGGQTQ